MPAFLCPHPKTTLVKANEMPVTLESSVTVSVASSPELYEKSPYWTTYKQVLSFMVQDLTGTDIHVVEPHVVVL
ncbi:hypothetical protein HanIR_Chr01g0030031 [Helianthus annuus]|nr:hypothetical protein HanIR_Chr01g0030031 [Helianthus annuus]